MPLLSGSRTGASSGPLGFSGSQQAGIPLQFSDPQQVAGPLQYSHIVRLPREVILPDYLPWLTFRWLSADGLRFLGKSQTISRGSARKRADQGLPPLEPRFTSSRALTGLGRPTAATSRCLLTRRRIRGGATSVIAMAAFPCDPGKPYQVSQGLQVHGPGPCGPRSFQSTAQARAWAFQSTDPQQVAGPFSPRAR